MQKINRKSLIVWYLNTLTEFILKTGATTIILLYLNDYMFVHKVCILAFVWFSFVFIKECLLHPLFYKNARFQNDEATIYIQKGALTVEQTEIPLKRIQHADIQQTFYSRMFHLYNVNIYTAGDHHTIGFITEDKANTLKETITDYLVNMGLLEDDD